MSQDLLSIDVEAAFSKVSLGRLRSADQAPLALVRAVAAARPRSVKVELRRTALAIEHDGRPCSSEVLGRLRVLLDRRMAERERQRALEALEALKLLDLLVAFTWGRGRVELAAGPPTSERLVRDADGQVRLEPAHLAMSRLTVFRPTGSTAAQISEIEQHLCFADFAVLLNGRRIDRGLHLENVVIEQAFERESCAGIVGLPRKGLAARTLLVVDGVLSQQTWDSPPSGAVWDAIVACPEEARSIAKNAVAEQVAELVREVPKWFGRIDSSDRGRVAELLFRLADHGAGAAAVAGVPLFRTLDKRRHTANQLKAAANGRVLRAIGPGARADRFDLSGTTYILDERERAFAERHLCLHVREPQRSVRSAGLPRRMLRRIFEAFRRNTIALLERLTAARSVPEEEVTEAERGFARRLEEFLKIGLVDEIAGAKVVFVQGRRAVRRRTGSRQGGLWLLLGRDNPDIRAMVRSVQKQPESLHAALLLLMDGRDPFGGNRAEIEARLLGMTHPE